MAKIKVRKMEIEESCVEQNYPDELYVEESGEMTDHAYVVYNGFSDPKHFKDWMHDNDEKEIAIYKLVGYMTVKQTTTTEFKIIKRGKVK